MKQDESQKSAIQTYNENTGRRYIPGEVVAIPTDALAFARYQSAWLTLDEFKRERCRYDPETNEWLVHYLTKEMLGPDVPPIYIDVLADGVALVDGVHRVTAYLIAGRQTILAHLNKETP